MKKKMVVLTGAGMSAESGIATFRDSGGLWDKYPVEQVATPQAFEADPELVLKFYNLVYTKYSRLTSFNATIKNCTINKCTVIMTLNTIC